MAEILRNRSSEVFLQYSDGLFMRCVVWCGLAGFACGRGRMEGEKVAEVWVFFWRVLEGLMEVGEGVGVWSVFGVGEG